MKPMEISADYNGAAWGSHVAALMACVAQTVDAVLEIGVGHFSTPLLHSVCAEEHRTLISVESDETWFNLFATIFNSNGHQFVRSIDAVPDLPWSVVFVDDSPGGANRAKHFQRFLQKAMYVVVHDYHHDNEEHIGPLLNGCKHHVCQLYQPPTLVASRRRDIPASVKIL